MRYCCITDKGHLEREDSHSSRQPGGQSQENVLMGALEGKPLQQRHPGVSADCFRAICSSSVLPPSLALLLRVWVLLLCGSLGPS